MLNTSETHYFSCRKFFDIHTLYQVIEFIKDSFFFLFDLGNAPSLLVTAGRGRGRGLAVGHTGPQYVHSVALIFLLSFTRILFLHKCSLDCSPEFESWTTENLQR